MDASNLYKFNKYGILVRFFLLPFFVNFTLISHTTAAEARCSVIIKGVENGKVDLDFYKSICGNEASKSERLREALRVGDGEVLKGFGQSSKALLAATFQQPSVAKNFFRFAKSQEALDWFKAQISSTISPNLVLNDKSVLELALLESNLSIARMLLEAGATPHVYSELWGTESYFPKMLFPLTWLHQLDVVGAPEEVQAFMHLYSQNVVAPNSKDAVDRGSVRAVEKRIAKFEEIYGLRVKRSSSICDVPVKEQCEKFAKEKSICSYASEFPKKVINHDYRSSEHRYLDSLDLLGLLGVYKGRLYFMTRNSYQNIGLLISNSNFTRVDLLGSDNLQSYHFCRGPNGLKKKQYRYGPCWRKISLDYISPTQMEVRGKASVKFQKYFCK